MTEHRVPSGSPDLTEENIQKLKQLFPEILTDGEKIDFEKLKLIMGEEVEESKEHYQFTWHGKRETIRGAQIPSKGTLKVDKASSKNFDTTENLYIEGDNLEVLKLLQKSYNGKIKMIYIDPPYNTGKDFVYKDNFHDGVDHYLEMTGQKDEEGNRLTTNTDSSGRFHTDWLNMMYPRLKLAKNLLTEDGVIFISIDDVEQEKLKLICNEIFGEQNFLAQVIWERAYAPINLKKNFSENHDFILVYGKNKNLIFSNGLKRDDAANGRYINPDNDSRGVWKPDNLSVGPAIEKNIYPIVTPSGRVVYPPSGRSWLYSEEKLIQMISDKRIWFGKEGNAVPSTKRFLNEVKNTITPMTIWNYKDVGHSQSASQNLKKLFDDKSYFPYPKPVELIKRMIELYSDKNSIVLDFFSGSSTTAHATMQLNAEDGGNRKYIMAQLPEETEEKSEAYKAGYKNICEIGKDRIRRAGEKIIEENPEVANTLDIGFKVLKLDKSNIREWNADFDDIERTLETFGEVFIPDAKEIDIVYEIMLKTGLELTLPINFFQVDGKNVYDIAFGNLFICLDDQIDRNIAAAIIEKRKEHEIDTSTVVFKDAGFANNDSEKLNCFEMLKDAGYTDEQLMTI